MQTVEHHDDVRRGALHLLAAAFFFSLMSVIVKRAGRGLPVEMLVLARGVVTLVLSWLVLRRKGISPWGVDRKRLLLRGLFGLGGLSCFFYALTAMPLAEVTVIHYLNPVITAGLAAVLLREAIGWRLVLALATGIVGTLLVARPAALLDGSSSLPPLGVAAALGGAFFSACAYTTVRRLRKTDDPHVIVFFFPLVAVPAVVPFAVRAWLWPSPTEWGLLLLLGVVVQIAQVLMTRGLTMMPAGQGTAIGYTQIAFAATWGWLLFDETPPGWTALGALCIVGGTLVLARGGAPTPRVAEVPSR